MFKKEENNIHFTIIHIFSLLGYKHISDMELYFRVKYKRSNSINVNVERYTLQTCDLNCLDQIVHGFNRDLRDLM